MASPGNQHCANCIGTLSFPPNDAAIAGIWVLLLTRHSVMTACIRPLPVMGKSQLRLGFADHWTHLEILFEL